MIQGNTFGPGPVGPTSHKKSPIYQFPIGVYIENASSNMIGGTGPGAANTISGNSVGVYVFGTAGSSHGNIISGNVINSNERYGILLYNAPSNTNSRNKLAHNKIANFREFSGPVAKSAKSSSSNGSKAKKPAHHSKQVVHHAPGRRASHALLTIHGQKVPAGPMRKARGQVRR
jgi:parallel beta-helix repeat protein